MLNDREPSTERTPRSSAEEPGQVPMDSLSEVMDVLGRVDRVLNDIRSAVDTSAREGRHKAFSPWRWVAAVVQVFAVGLVALAALDWVFGAASEALLTKLAFAGVLQVGALTGFVVSQRAST